MPIDAELCFDDLLDVSFQAVLCGVLLHNEQFLARARGIIEPRYFGSEVYRNICKGIFRHWDTYGKTPPVSALKIEVSKFTEFRETRDSWMQVIEQLQHMPPDERDPVFVANELVSFAQRAQVSIAVRDAWNDITKFSIQELANKLDKILKLRAIFEDLGLNLRTDYPDAYAVDPRTSFPTGFSGLDAAMRGGLREGELAAITAPSKRGKSLVLMNVGAGLMIMGYNVIHYTLEMQHIDVLKRYVSLLCNVPTNSLDEHITNVHDCMKMLERVTDATIIVKEFPARAITFETIEAHYNMAQTKGRQAVPIVDYADLVRGPNDKMPEWQEIHETYMHLRNLGREYNVPVITASQTNASGMEAGTIEQWHMSGSTRKGFTSDYVWGMNQSKSDYQLSRFRLVPFLNRHCRKDTTIWMLSNYETGRLRETTEEEWKKVGVKKGDDDDDKFQDTGEARVSPSPLQS